MFLSAPDGNHKIKVYSECIMHQLFLCCCDTLTKSNLKKQGFIYLQICLEGESIMAEVAEQQVTRTEISHLYPHVEIRQNKPNLG